MGFPPGFEPGISRTTMHHAPMAHHLGVDVRTAILCPYETRCYDIIRLFLRFPSLDFVGLWTVTVKKETKYNILSQVKQFGRFKQLNAKGKFKT